MCRLLWVVVLLLSVGKVAAEPVPTLFSSHSISTVVAGIDLQGDARQQRQLNRWLMEIAQIPVGFSTLAAISRSHHQLTIKHSAAARLSAGRTIAPMTNDLINGIGANVTILFDMDMEDQGTHRVYGVADQLIEFTAIQNLFHELVHAKHQMRGTWRYFASERQAIEEENDFRRQLALHHNQPLQLRYRQAGVPIDQVDAATASAPAL